MTKFRLPPYILALLGLVGSYLLGSALREIVAKFRQARKHQNDHRIFVKWLDLQKTKKEGV